MTKFVTACGAECVDFFFVSFYGSNKSLDQLYTGSTGNGSYGKGTTQHDLTPCWNLKNEGTSENRQVNRLYFHGFSLIFVLEHKSLERTVGSHF
jgi:hypothetical protein